MWRMVLENIYVDPFLNEILQALQLSRTLIDEYVIFCALVAKTKKKNNCCGSKYQVIHDGFRIAVPTMKTRFDIGVIITVQKCRKYNQVETFINIRPNTDEFR